MDTETNSGSQGLSEASRHSSPSTSDDDSSDTAHIPNGPFGDCVSLLRRIHSQMTADNHCIDDADITKLHNILRGSTAATDSFVDGKTALHIAAGYGLVQAAEKLVQEGGDVLATDEHGRQPLHVAVFCGHERFVSFLCENGAAFDVRDDRDCIPLEIAIEEKHADIMQILLAQRSDGADLQLESRDDRGRTPLLIASMLDFADGVRMLLDRGVNCNVQSDTSKSTPLIAATSWGHTDVVRALLDSDAQIDMNIRDGDRQTALHNAVLGNLSKIVELLLRRSDVEMNLADEHGQTALHLASEKGNESIVKMLLAAKAEVDIKDNEGKTALHLASGAEYDGTNQVESALRESVDSDSEDKRNEETQPKLHTSVVQVLLNGNANRRETTNTKETIIHLAAACGEARRLELVLDGTDEAMLFSQDSQGTSALCSVFKWHKPEIAIEILKNARIADFHHSNLEDHVLVWAATDVKTHDIVTWLLCNRPDRIELKKPAEIDDWTSIQWAAHEQLPRILTLLIASSPNTTTTNDALSSALMSALELIKTSDEKSMRRQLPLALWVLITYSKRTAEIENARIAAAESVATLKKQRQTTHQKSQKKNDLLRSETGATLGKRKIQGKSNSVSKTVHDGQQMQPKPAGLVLEDFQTIEDILNDPPFGRSHKDIKTYDLPTFEEDLSEILESFKATIVQFYKEENVSGTLRRNRPVKDIIYDPGPTKIMQTANKLRTAVRHLDTIGEKRSELEIRPEFTWVHLPSTNMDWMNDLLKRIMKDEGYETREYHEFRSFFRDSWVEVPDKTASSRLMRPRTTVMSREDLTNKKHDKNSKKGEDETEERNKGDKVEEEKTEEEKIEIFGELREVEKSKESSEQKMVGNDDTEGTHLKKTSSESIAASAIYMPYLCFSTHSPELAELDKSLANETQTNESQELKSPVGKIKADVTQPGTLQGDKSQPSEENRDFGQALNDYKTLLRAYQRHEGSVVHRSPTLDEWYYHFDNDEKSAKDKHHRNETQVVTNFIAESKNMKSGEKHDTEGNKRRKLSADERSTSPGPSECPLTLLRVNQLWVWTIENKWLITATSCVLDNNHGEIVEEILDLVSKQAEYGGSWSQPGSAVAMSRVIIEYCIGLYEKRPKSGIPMSIGQMFSNHMNRIGRDETALFEEFRSRTRSWQSQGNKSRLLVDQGQLESTRKPDGEKPEEEIRKATRKAEKIYCSIKDFRDELNILKSVAKHQKTVQKGLPVPGKRAKDTELLATYVVNDLQELDNIAERIQSAVNTTLSLHQSEIANIQAGLSAEQGKVLMVFTFATLLFLPLSFLTSLFALDVASFLQTPGWAFFVIFLVSVAVSVIVALSAIYSSHIAKLAKHMYRTAAKSVETTGSSEGVKDGFGVISGENSRQPTHQATAATENQPLGLRDRLRRRGGKQGGSVV